MAISVYALLNSQFSENDRKFDVFTRILEENQRGETKTQDVEPTFNSGYKFQLQNSELFMLSPPCV